MTIAGGNREIRRATLAPIRSVNSPADSESSEEKGNGGAYRER